MAEPLSCANKAIAFLAVALGSVRLVVLEATLLAPSAIQPFEVASKVVYWLPK